MKRPRIVEIEWVDSGMPLHGWHPRDEPSGIVHCVSVGYLWRKSKKKIVLMQSLNDHQWAGSIGIPRSAIRKMKRVR